VKALINGSEHNITFVFKNLRLVIGKNIALCLAEIYNTTAEAFAEKHREIWVWSCLNIISMWTVFFTSCTFPVKGCHIGQLGTVTPTTVPVGCLVEQGLTSHSTQFRSFRIRCFYRSDDPTNSVKALKDGG